ncbi:hypothetical protein SORBI_3003G095301 [Sorghum bicolor]|uniref:Uncharacterized protein n=1 Tax=Sorghum bicolor TaxID=4558 RepID=A0A1W0VWH1_SORBI|nr:hypothetical protein SORBI_3003G095301 [Sorghum bicolor]
MSCQGMSPRAHHPCLLLIHNLHGAQLHILPSLIVSLASPICSFIQVQLRSAFFVHPWQAGPCYTYTSRRVFGICQWASSSGFSDEMRETVGD